MYYTNRQRYEMNDNHIQDEQMYRDAVRNLHWNNGKGQGERWKYEEVIPQSNIDFNQEYFTPYDYLYAVNTMYADYGKMSEDKRNYMQMANDYMHNDSFPERADERAYYDAEQRSRRYMNRYPRYEYNNRRRYNERNSFGDRDNDGRYNE